MNTLTQWLSPANREKIYTAIAALAPIFVAAGLVLPSNVEPIMVLVGAGLQVFSGVLALVHLKPTDAARWFGTVGRGVIYGGATTVAAAVVTLGFITQDWANGALTYVSLGLTALQAILAVVTPKEVSFPASDTPVVVKAVVTTDNAVVSPVQEPVAEATPVVVVPDAEPEPTGDGA